VPTFETGIYSDLKNSLDPDSLLYNQTYVCKIVADRPVLITRLFPRGELGHQRRTLSPKGNCHPFVHPHKVEQTIMFRRMEGRTPRGENSPKGTKFITGGQLHPWGIKFAPWVSMQKS
jgi:hypothetical protein